MLLFEMAHENQFYHNLITILSGVNEFFTLNNYLMVPLTGLKPYWLPKDFIDAHGIDYHDTFSPVVNPTIFRIIVSLAMSPGWSLRQLDVNNAFLQGHLTEDIFMVQPSGFINSSSPTHVCKLQKAIYSLKQVPRAWYLKLRTFLVAFGFANSHATHHCLSIKMEVIQFIFQSMSMI